MYGRAQGRFPKQEEFKIVKQSVTKDVNPQFLRLAVEESSINTFTEASASTPVIPTSNLVMEILKIFIELSIPGATGITTADKSRAALYDRSRATMAQISDVGVLATAGMLFGTTSEGATKSTFEIDLTDNNGNGVIFAKPLIFLGVESVNAGVVMLAACGILYRLKRVSANELIGAIQE